MGRFINADAYTSTGQGIIGNNMFAYCLNNSVQYVDDQGSICVKAHTDTPGSEDDDPLNDARGGGNPQGEQITLYRAVSPAEGSSAVNSQRFSAGPNSYENGKFFATSQADAQKWGEIMYHGEGFEVISGTFHSQVISSSGIVYYASLDAIGPAYLIPISALNMNVISICHV